MMSTSLVPLAILALLRVQDGSAPPAPPSLSERAVELFRVHCATCHGERGDGQGVSELDRPARNFADGGFSFGNTPEALFRTISSGIPGTPMPAFDRALTEEERRLVAEHVIALGPEAPAEPPRDTELVVADRPLVVRGLLPAVADDVPVRPRGLLVGLPSGLTAEYRTDDVRLLALRLGRFVDRRDWIGRGGTALQPLGQVVELFDGGDPGPAFALAPKSGLGTGKNLIELRARSAGSWVRGGEAGIRYALSTPDGRRIAHVEESLRLVPTSIGAGFARRFRFEPECEEAETLVALALHQPRADLDDVESMIVSAPPSGPTWSIDCGQVTCWVERESETAVRMLVHPRPSGYALHERLGLGTFALQPCEAATFEEAWFTFAKWDEAAREAFKAEVLVQ